MMRDKLPAWIGSIGFSIGLWGAAALLAGCAMSADQMESPPNMPPMPPFADIKAAPDSFKGRPVILAGQVLAARRMKDGTRIEILQLPTNSAHQPSLDLTRSQGRFVAMQREFLDPATIPQGTFVTVSGEIAGSVTLPLDDTDYTYPVVDIRELRTWSNNQDRGYSRVGGFYGYPYGGPFWHPFWGPYGRGYPYYW